MSTKVVVYGPGLIAAGRVTKPAQAALDDLALRGFVSAVHAREPEETAADHLRRLYKGLTGAHALVLLPGWEDVRETVVLGQMAVSLELPIHVYTAPGEDLRTVGRDDVVAPIMPGYGVIAPDADENELPHDEAARIVLGPRGAFYDSPLRNFERIALIWSGILFNKLKDGERITAEDIPLCMTGVKLSRETFRHKRDNLVDSHGYLITYQMVLDERAKAEESEAETHRRRRK